MLTQAWFIAALIAAILWGAAYTIAEKLLRLEITPAFLMLISQVITIPIFLFIVLKMENFQEQFSILMHSKSVLFLCIFMALAIVGGNLLVLYSMSEKNATLTSLIEISYPIFVFIFSWIFLKEIQINWQQAIGGFLIFAGVAIIYLKT